MKNYIILNKETIQKRIDELKNKRDVEHNKGHDKSAMRYENTILELKHLLSQSIPLIPEIEKAFTEGQKSLKEKVLPKKTATVYISNLKLDI